MHAAHACGASCAPCASCASRASCASSHVHCMCLDQDELARRYLAMCEEHPPSKGAPMARGHLFKILHHGLRSHPELREELLLAR